MSSHNSGARAWLHRLGPVLLAATLVLAALGLGRSATADTSPDTASGPVRVLLPLIQRAPNDTLFGVQMDPLTDANGFSRVVSAGASWTRRNGVLWSAVEPTEGARNWGALAGLDQELARAAAAGLRVILIVRGTPEWAQEVNGSQCGPIRADKLAAFGEFMHALVARYSAGPYFVRHWELWNEPDIAPVIGPESSQEYGCWGDPGDAYYGGGRYAAMLAAVTPRIKAADPAARVYVGGLLLDCDPANPPAGKDCTPSRYLEGIVRAGGGAHFDGVSFHAYDFYGFSVGSYGNANWGSASSSTGPVGSAKAAFIRQVLAAYGVAGKDLVNTETALLCYGCVPANINDDFEGTKTFYVAQTYAAAIRDGLLANVWYNALGWFNSGLLDGNANPRFAYQALVVSRNELGRATFARDITEYPGVLGHAFDRPGGAVWLLWSRTSAGRTVALPGTPARLVDVFGGAIPVTGPSVTIDAMPVYVIW